MKVKFRMVLQTMFVFLFVACSSVLPAIPVGAVSRESIVFQRDVTDSNNQTLGRQIWAMNADGTNKRALTGVGNTYQPELSPDGTRLTYVDLQIGLIVMDIATGTSQVLVPAGSEFPHYPVSPTWSLDGSQIAYSKDFALYVVSANGGTPTLLSADGRAPSWSPDGQWIAFEAQGGGATQLFKIRPDGSDKTQLTSDTSFHGSPAWSPDSSKLVYACGTAVAVCFYDLSTGQMTTSPQFVPTGGHVDSFTWTSDPNKLLISAYIVGNGTYRIYSINVDGTNRTELSNAGPGSGFWADTNPDFGVIEDGTVPNEAPELSAISGPTAPVLVNTQITASASFTDVNSADTHTATWDWGDGTTSSCPANTSDCTLTESDGSGTTTAHHIYTANGVYEITLTVSDGNLATQQSFQYVNVYDASPLSMFIGALAFTSPAGSYPADPTVSGSTLFSVTARYQGTTPTANISMRFNQANINFKATSTTVFVTANGTATLRGTGTINGTGSYNVLVTGLDGGLGNDRIRFQIKDASTGVVVYDSQMGATDTAVPTALVQGQVIVN